MFEPLTLGVVLLLERGEAVPGNGFVPHNGQHCGNAVEVGSVFMNGVYDKLEA